MRSNLALNMMRRLIILLVVILGFMSSVSWSEDQLLSPSKLKMFVDELPDMPKIRGFDVVQGVPKSKSLNIGMFRKKWVRVEHTYKRAFISFFI